MNAPALFFLICMTGIGIWFLSIWYPGTDHAATRRWKQRNAMQPTTCMCGKPGTVKRFAPYPVVGKAQPFWWHCDEHASMSLNTPWTNGYPMVQDAKGVWHEPVESLMARGLVREATAEDYERWAAEEAGRDA